MNHTRKNTLKQEYGGPLQDMSREPLFGFLTNTYTCIHIDRQTRWKQYQHLLPLLVVNKWQLFL